MARLVSVQSVVDGARLACQVCSAVETVALLVRPEAWLERARAFAQQHRHEGAS